MDKNYLQHYGVEGMKWGVRRYENPDGTLTDAGKRRYARREAAKARRSEKINRPNYHVNKREVKRNMDRMSDAELQKALNRIDMQNRVDKMNPSIIESGYRKTMNAMREMTQTMGAITALYFAYKKLREL